ncbi:MAG TPA: arylsulfotransferase family protein [Gemmatimonadota bacterium]|nr:arylsulfotransferase family protein [Gemmatimonadota bacterium]
MSSRVKERVERGVFVVSLLVLVFILGYATRFFGWFPDRFLERAWLQADTAMARAAALPVNGVSPRVYDRQGARTLDPGDRPTRPTLVTSIWKASGWKPGVRLIDADGRVLHAWHLDPEKIFRSGSFDPRAWNDPDLQGAVLLPGGDVVVNVEYVGVVRLDACSHVLWSLEDRGHHSITRARGGGFWIPAVAKKDTPRTPAHPDGLPGLSGAISEDLLTRVSDDGRVLERINVLDVLYANGLQRLIAKHGEEHENDITHLNDIEPLPDSLAGGYPMFEAGDLLVSLHNLDLVMVIDPDTHRVKWHATQPFIHQHDPDWMGDGWIGVFDNEEDGTARGTLLGGSRIVAIRPRTGTLRTLFPTPESDPFYTSYRGKWQRLPDGDLLLTETRAGRIVQVAPDGHSVWEWVAPRIDDEHVPEVTEGTRYDVSPDTVASWPCSPAQPAVPEPS